MFHPASKVVVQDDTILYLRKPPLAMRIFGFSPFSMHFHPSMTGPGLRPTPEAPLEFMAWFQKLLREWDFEHLISAHTGGCYTIGKIKAAELLAASTPLLKQLSTQNAGESVELVCKPTQEGWSTDPTECECG
eukprot:SAG25_NODE_438_length_8018_cov_7.819800_10_plen_133_part_00